MKYLRILAALLMALTLFVHVFAGGPEIMDPVHASALPALLIDTLWVVWHGISLCLGLLAVALAYLCVQRSPALLVMCCALMLGFSALFIVAAVGIPGGFVALPQWGIFLVIPALAWAGRISS